MSAGKSLSSRTVVEVDMDFGVMTRSSHQHSGHRRREIGGKVL
jgi:hypothetical protein